MEYPLVQQFLDRGPLVQAESATLDVVLVELVVAFDEVVVIVVVARLAGLPLGRAEPDASVQSASDGMSFKTFIVIKQVEGVREGDGLLGGKLTGGLGTRS